MGIHCEIVSYNRLVFKGDVDMVLIPGINGEMGILPHHAPLLTLLKIGVVKVRYMEQEDFYAISGGLAHVQADAITILADTAENVDEIDVERAEAAKIRAQDLLRKERPQMDMHEVLAIEAALRLSNLRLNTVRRYRSRRNSIPLDRS